VLDWRTSRIRIHAGSGDVSRARQKLAELQAFQAQRYVDPARSTRRWSGFGMDLRTADSLCTPQRPVCKTSLDPVR